MKLTHFLLLLPFLIYSQNFIQIEKDLVNIRFDLIKILKKLLKPSLVKIFLSTASTKKWVQIEVPSGEKRWIYKKLTSQVNDYGAILDTVNISDLKQSLIRAENRLK